LLNLDFANEIYATNDEPSALDDIVTYTRNSSASFWNRRINRNGKYETFLDTDYVGSVTNLLEYSEDHTQSSYTFAGSISVDSTPLIKNGLKFWKITDTGNTDGQHRQIATVPTVDTKYTISIDILPIDNAVVEMGFLFTGGADPDGFIACQFNTQNGSLLGERTANATGEVSAYYLGDGIYRLVATIDDNGDNTTCTAIFRPSFNNNGSTSIDNNATGSQYVTRFQLTESSKELPYVKTLASSASETFVESPRLEYDPITAQPLGYLAEGASTNLVIDSETFEDWGQNNATTSVNQIIAPDKTKSADEVIEASDSAQQHRVTKGSISVNSGTAYTSSVYCKQGNGDRNMRIYLFSTLGALNCYATFDLSTGTIVDTAGVDYDSSTITDVGNGWFRCSVTGTASGTQSDVQVLLYLANGTLYGYDGDGTSSMYFWGHQMEALPFASSYIRTEGSTVQRVNETLQLSSGIVNEARQSITLSAEARQSFFPNDTQRFIMSINMDGSAQSFLSTTTGNNFRHRNGETASSTNFTLTANNVDQFYKSALSFNGSESRLFVNGDFDISNSDSGGDVTLSNIAINIGTNDGGSSASHWYGNIKSVKIYDEALLDQEVSLL
jgi:hypothetical protein